MNFDLIWYVRIAESFAIILGLILVYLSIRAYKSGGGLSFFYSAIAFSLIIVSSLMEGVFVDILNTDVTMAHAARVTFFASGFFMLIYSIRKV